VLPSSRNFPQKIHRANCGDPSDADCILQDAHDGGAVAGLPYFLFQREFGVPRTIGTALAMFRSQLPASRRGVFFQPNKTSSMNAQFLKEQWSLIRDKLREKYPNLTENDLAYVRGSEEEVFDRVERRTGVKREQVESKILEEIRFA